MSGAPPFFKHPLALVESDAIGAGTRVWAWAHVMPGARIGSRCNVGEHCFIEQDVVVGDDVVIKNGISIYAGVTIEDGVFLGPNVVFTNDLAPRSGVPKPLVRTVVRRGASIGANATLVANIEIGEFASVGAGSVVTRNVPPHALVVGVPARQRGWVCHCGRKLRQAGGAFACECGRRYGLAGGRLAPLP